MLSSKELHTEITLPTDLAQLFQFARPRKGATVDAPSRDSAAA
jgi:hypothetical protein